MSAALLFVLPPTGETSVSQFELDPDSFIRKGQHAAVEQVRRMLEAYASGTVAATQAVSSGTKDVS